MTMRESPNKVQIQEGRVMETNTNTGKNTVGPRNKILTEGISDRQDGRIKISGRKIWKIHIAGSKSNS